MAVPAGAVASFRRMTGVDLGFVPMITGPAVSATATAAEARGYTSAGAVHLPGDGDPVRSGETDALLAHELTHVAQQRVLGAAVAGDLGPALEAQASAVERAARLGIEDALAGLDGSGLDGLGLDGFGEGAFGGGDAATQDSDVGGMDRAERAGRDDGWDDAAQAALAGALGAGLAAGTDPDAFAPAAPAGLTWTPMAGFLPASEVAATAAEPQHAPRVASQAPPAAPPLRSDAQPHPFSAARPGFLRAPDGASVAEPEELHAALAALEERVDELTERVGGSGGRGSATSSVGRTRVDVDALSARLYDRLRTELVVERERSGLLYEFR